jgi:methylmalonyl-CoA/ethylmalonyl-CoA epimerase
VASEQTPCTARNLDHVCLAVRNAQETMDFYADTFGLPRAEVAELPDQGVRACLLAVGSSQLEIIEPTDPQGPVARFIERRGEGLHHVAFEVEDLGGQLRRLRERGVELIDAEPREGLAGSIAFLHPRATRGVLVELVQKEPRA